MADYSDVGAVFPLKDYAITGVDTGTEEFVVAGDQSVRFSVGDRLGVVGSTGNDGNYTVASVSYAAGPDETTIEVNEDITNATVDGTILHDEIADVLLITESHDDSDDRDAGAPDQYAGAHARRLANELRALGRTLGGAVGFPVLDGGGLYAWYGGGSVIFGSGAPIEAWPGRLLLADNDVSYIEVNETAAVSANVIGFSVGKYPLAEVTTAGGVITVIDDKRGALYLAEFAEANLDNFGPAFDATTELTLSGGVITRTQGVHRVDTEGDAPSDDLVTINGTADDFLLLIRAENAARTVVIKQTGNILTGGSDITLDNTDQFVILLYDTTLSKWVVAGGAAADLTGVLLADGSVDILNSVYNAGTELTLAGGVITRTQAVHTVDTEGDSPTDDLVTVNGGADGLVLRVRAENAARTVVLKETGNLALGGTDITLDDTNRFVDLYYDGTLSKWLVVGDGGGSPDLSPYLKKDGTVDIQNSTYEAATELTISGGVITRTQAVHTVDTEGDSPTDDLVTVNGGADGLVLWVRAENAARTVVLKETGNLALGGTDITLDDTNRFVDLSYDGTLSKWLVVGDGGGSVTGVLKADGSVDIINSVYNAAAELTIAAGVVTRTQAVHTIDTQGDIASDDLDTISGGADGLIIRLRAEDAARTVILKHGTGNLELGGVDITLDDTDRYVELYYDGTLSKWLALGSPGARVGLPVTLELGHGEFPDGLTDEEIHRFQLQAGEVFILDRLEYQQKGGGSSASVSINVYDSTGASQIDTVNLGSVSTTGGSSSAAALILVRATNSSGGQITGSPIVRGRIS